MAVELRRRGGKDRQNDDIGSESDFDVAPALIADGDPAFHAFLWPLLDRLGLPAVSVTTGADALSGARRRRPALVVIDVVLPDLSGFEVCRALREEFGEELPVVLVSGEKTDDHDRVAGLLLGADDYLAKPVDATLFLARVRRLVVRGAAAARVPEEEPSSPGDQHFTPREREVLSLLADGHNRSTIARMLVISPRTVGSHIEHLLTKLGVHSQAQAVAKAYRQGLLAPAASQDR
jgi:DNA-binding NarL/FixJ family response regulator